MTEMIDLGTKVKVIIVAVFEALGIAFDNTVDTIMPYLQLALQKYSAWKTGEYTMWIIFGVVLILGAIAIFIVESKTEITEGFLYLVGAIMLIIGIIVCMVNVYYLIRLINFPEIGFVEWATVLLKSKS